MIILILFWVRSLKFLFIYPSSGKLEIASKKMLSAGAWLPPLGLLYLSSILENKGYQVEVIDCNGEANYLNSIKKSLSSTDFVGITLYSTKRELECSKMVADFIKKTDPSIPIIIGGPHCSLYPEKAIKEHNADICVPRSGDHIIAPIAEALEGKRKISSIPGIYYRVGNQIVNTKPIDCIRNIEDIPFPARHLIEKYDYGYMVGVKLAKGKVTSICSGIGCPFSCRFCNLHMHVPRYSGRSTDSIIEEVDEIVNHGYSTLTFVDDNFMVKPKNVEKVMDHIIQNNYDLRIWILGARVDSANRKLYEKMRDAGVDYIIFGIESGNQDVLDFYNKKITISQIEKAVNLSYEMGFFPTATFILGAPIEKKEHLENTIKFAKSIPLSAASFFPFGYVYHSDIWKKEVEKGNIQPDEGDLIGDSRRGLGNFTADELEEYTMKAQKSFYRNPTLWINEIKRAFKTRDTRFLKVGFRMMKE